MLHPGIMIFHTSDVDKKYNEELQLRSMNVSRSHTNLLPSAATFMLISFVGLIGNATVFWLLCCTIKKTKFTVYVTNMAVSDIMVLAIHLLAYIEIFINLSKRLSMLTILTKLYRLGQFSCFFLLGALIVERCLTVFFPVWYPSCRPKYTTTFVCVVLWALSIIMSVIESIFCNTVYSPLYSIGFYTCSSVAIGIFTVIFILLTPIIIFSSLALFIRTLIKPQQNFPARLDISILLVVSLQCIFYISVTIIDIIDYWFMFTHNLECYDIFRLLDFIANSVRPFIYLLVGCWKREKTQEPFHMFLERALSDGKNGNVRIQPEQEQT